MSIQPKDRAACTADAPHAGEKDILDQLDLTGVGSVTRELAGPSVPSPSPATLLAPLVGSCVDDRHPTLNGRVLVRWDTTNGEACESWLPTLQGLTIRVADRVLLQHPANWPEAVVVGVVDGFAARPARDHTRGPVLSLSRDEGLHVVGVDGTELLEVYQGESGPVVRLLSDDVNLELPGKLSIDAKSIELNARAGGVTIKAKDDVIVRGEMIELN